MLFENTWLLLLMVVVVAGIFASLFFLGVPFTHARRVRKQGTNREGVRPNPPTIDSPQRIRRRREVT